MTTPALNCCGKLTVETPMVEKWISINVPRTNPNEPIQFSSFLIGYIYIYTYT
jgi:hypothetical protein